MALLDELLAALAILGPALRMLAFRFRLAHPGFFPPFYGKNG